MRSILLTKALAQSKLSTYQVIPTTFWGHEYLGRDARSLKVIFLLHPHPTTQALQYSLLYEHMMPRVALALLA